MNANRLLIEATKPQVRKTRKKDPKPWTIVSPETTPQFEQTNGKDAIHIGFELARDTEDTSKLTLTDKKLFFSFKNEVIIEFSSEIRGRLGRACNVPGYAVFSCGFFLTARDVDGSDKQTRYKRAWQMTYEEWKAGKPLTIDIKDEKQFWNALNAYTAKYKEDGRARKSGVRKDSTETASVGSAATPAQSPGPVPDLVQATSPESISVATPGSAADAIPDQAFAQASFAMLPQCRLC